MKTRPITFKSWAAIAVASGTALVALAGIWRATVTTETRAPSTEVQRSDALVAFQSPRIPTHPERAATPVTTAPPQPTADTAPATRAAANAVLTQRLLNDANRVLVRDEFSRQQVAVRSLVCEGQQCQMALQFPPFAEASVRHNLKATSDLLDAFREVYAKQGAKVALTEVSQSDEGIRMGVQIDTAEQHGRLMTSADIAKIRAETLKEYLNAESAGKARTAHGGQHVP